MPQPQLKLFNEELDESLTPTPIVLRSIELPPYTWPIGNDISSVLTKLGYEVSEEGHRNTNKRFVVRKTDHGCYQWGSRALYVNYAHMAIEVGLSVLSSERRKNEALEIAKALEDKLTEGVKKYLKEVNDEEFTKRAKERIPTLRD